MVKCPKCGFDSADGAQWCDFCKEPFNKTPAPSVDFSALDAGERMPAWPPWLRAAAWAFLNAMLIALMALMGYYMCKENAQESGALSQRR